MDQHALNAEGILKPNILVIKYSANGVFMEDYKPNFSIKNMEGLGFFILQNH